MHEMIHCMLWYHGNNDFDAHEKKFNKYVNMICELYGFNKEEF